MRRRDFITMIAGTVTAWPVAAIAQRAGTRRVGVLLGYQESDPRAQTWLTTFTDGLAELGWSSGANLQVEIRWADSNLDLMRKFAKELVGLKPDVVLAFGTPATAALQQETRTIPIVFTLVADPVGQGFVSNEARPGGNITGFSAFEFTIGGKWLELLAQVAPGLKRVAMIFNPDTAPGHGNYFMPDFESAARSSQVTPIAAAVHTVSDLEDVIADLGLNNREQMIAAADRNRVPAIYPWREVTAAGGLLSYGPDLEDFARRTAPYVNRILQGENPADLPVQVPTKFQLVINLKTAKALGLTVSRDVLLIADEVIE
jgi:putative tryptophan/tyrosine transport system substrate-binding protein